MRDKGETLIVGEFIELKEDGLWINNAEGHLVYNKITIKLSLQKKSLTI